MVDKRFVDDYETVVTTDAEGHEKEISVYRGDDFEISLDQDDIFNFRKNSLLLLVTIVILHISGGFISNQGMYQLYVALPYVIAYFPLLYMAVGILLLPKEKRMYRRDEIGHSYYRLRTSLKLSLILLGIGVLGEILFIAFVSTRDLRMLDYVYLMLQVITIALVYFLFRSQKQIHIQPFYKK